MANPFHDDTGRFCSRDQMLTCIHTLASTGKVNDYIKLKAEFDEIDKSNTVISKDFLSSLLKKAGVVNENDVEEKPAKEVLTTPNYSVLSGETLDNIIRDLGYKTSIGDGDYRQEILQIVKESGYHEEALYAAVEESGLTYEQKAKLANEHDPALYSLLAKKYPKEVFTQDKENFIQAIKTVSVEENKDSTRVFQLTRMTESLAENAENKEDLQIAVDATSYGHYTSNTTTLIMQSKFVTKEIAATVLDGEITAGKDNYWEARDALTRNLSSRGFLMIRHPQFNETPTPLAGSAPEADVNNAEQLASSIKNNNRFNKREKREEIKTAYVKTDIYSNNLKELHKKYKKLTSIRSTTEAEAVKQRIQNAVTRLNELEDYDVVKRHIEMLKF